MNTQNQITKNDDENPFKDMGFIKFWIVSTVFWFSFPVSLVLCYLTFGTAMDGIAATQIGMIF